MNRRRFTASLLSLGLCLPLGVAHAGRKGEPVGSGQSSEAQSGGRKGGKKKKKNHPSIRKGKVKQFHGVNGEASDVVDSVFALSAQVTGLKQSIKLAAGLAKKKPLTQAFSNMKQLNGKNFQVTTNNAGVPRVTTTNASPAQKVLDFVSTVNLAATESVAIAQTVRGYPAQIQGLIGEIQALPAQLTPTLLSDNGLNANDLQKQAKVITHNLDVLNKTAAETKKIVEDTNLILGQIRSLAQ